MPSTLEDTTLQAQIDRCSGIGLLVLNTWLQTASEADWSRLQTNIRQDQLKESLAHYESRLQQCLVDLTAAIENVNPVGQGRALVVASRAHGELERAIEHVGAIPKTTCPKIVPKN